jgi:hypothetical protein
MAQNGIIVQHVLIPVVLYIIKGNAVVIHMLIQHLVILNTRLLIIVYFHVLVNQELGNIMVTPVHKLVCYNVHWILLLLMVWCFQMMYLVDVLIYAHLPLPSEIKLLLIIIMIQSIGDVLLIAHPLLLTNIQLTKHVLPIVHQHIISLIQHWLVYKHVPQILQ